MIDRYSRPEFTALWSDQRRYETWLEVELAVCRVMESRGEVPKGTADGVAAAVTIDAERILAIEADVRHDVIAFLTHVEEQAGGPARWLHLGMTSSDVLDTAFALQLRAALDRILAAIDPYLEALQRRAEEFRHTPMMGRTHGMHAEPTTVGLVFLSLYSETRRNRERLERARQAISVGKIAGAVGVYGNIGPDIEAATLRALGLSPESCATQVVSRDRHAELFTTLALVAGGIDRLALQVRHWQRTEVGEAREPFGTAQKGSSAMPHKRNPILSENLCGLARLVRAHAQAALDNIALWHERDISHSSVERVIAPDATTLVDFMLSRATRIVEGLTVDVARCQNHLETSGELIFSEAVMLALVGKGVARQEAYRWVQRSAMAALEGEGRFGELLRRNEDITIHLGDEEIARCLDLGHHLRHVDLIFDRVLKGEQTEC